MRVTLSLGKTLEFHSLTGRVVSANKSFETRMQANTTVSSGGANIHGTNGNISGYVAPTRHTTTVNSQTVEHQEIFLEDASGQQHAIKLWDWSVSCAPGHELSLIWAIPVGMSSGPYLHIKNHTTRQDYRPNHLIENLIITPSLIKWLLFKGAALSIVLVPVIAWIALGWFKALIIGGAWIWLVKYKLITVKRFGDPQADIRAINNTIDAELQAVESNLVAHTPLRCEAT